MPSPLKRPPVAAESEPKRKVTVGKFGTLPEENALIRKAVDQSGKSAAAYMREIVMARVKEDLGISKTAPTAAAPSPAAISAAPIDERLIRESIAIYRALEAEKKKD